MSLAELTAWELTRLISPRGRVRVASQQSDGEALNQYPTQRSLAEAPPALPWAVYLADDGRRYRLLCFDLDAKRGNAAYDAARLAYWLDELNIEHLVAISGPSGGRHVWIALSETLDAASVRELAELSAQLLPSLDITPLTNPATGCVRPPGAPHRQGGVSTSLGSLRVLTRPAVARAQLGELRALLIDAGAELTVAPSSTPRGVSLDHAGNPYLAGSRRPLSSRIQQLIDQPPADDASYTLAIVLAGCAQARWHHSDVVAILETAPALEHARTQRTANGRRAPRTAAGTARALGSAWRHAVLYVAARPANDSDGADEHFSMRVASATDVVERLQTRANAMPGQWGADRASSAARATGGTHSRRAILDALCLYMLQAAGTTVEADVRRLSADTGYGRTTVYEALRSLTTPPDPADQESAWIVRVGDIETPHGQRYRPSQRFSTEETDDNRTQVLARPSESTLAHRNRWIHRLTSGLRALAHDTFCAPASLGRTAGLVYKYIRDDATLTVFELTVATGLDSFRVRRALRQLQDHRLLEAQAEGWKRTNPRHLDEAAVKIKVAGYLKLRRSRYELERAVWGWWSAECAWMRKRRKKRRGRRAPTGVALFTQNDRPDYARYPRRPTGHPDHGTARRLVLSGILDATHVDELAA